MTTPVEVVVATLDNGDSMLFINASTVYGLECWEKGVPPLSVGNAIAEALDVPIQVVSMQTPSDEDWNWQDVFELIPPPPHDAATTLPTDSCQKSAYTCENCGWEGSENDLDPMDDWSERTLTGYFCPAGVCPECAATVDCNDSEITDLTLEGVARIMRDRGWHVAKPNAGGQP